MSAEIRNEQRMAMTKSIYSIVPASSQSIEQLVLAGNYDGEVDAEITQENFPEDLGLENHDIWLICMGHEATTKTVAGQIDKLGYREANMRELLIFGKQYPDIEHPFAIAAPGPAWLPPHIKRHSVTLRCVGLLFGDSGLRSVCLSFVGDSFRWDADTQFLVVRRDL